jgi:hypothetical protein
MMTPRFGRLAALVPLASLACGGGHHLSEYSFANHKVAVVSSAPYAPELWTPGYDIDAKNPVTAVLEAGTKAAREVEGNRARARLDSAAEHVDVGKRMAARTLERASRYLGAAPVEDRTDADYLLEVDVRRLAIDARGRDAARLFMKGEAILLDRATGREIWHTGVEAHDRLTPHVEDGGDVAGAIVTAGVLTTVSVDDFERMLENLSDLASDAVTDRLRKDLRGVR